MSDLNLRPAIEAAAQADWARMRPTRPWHDLTEEEQAEICEEMTPVVKAAAPIIARAQALRTLADVVSRIEALRAPEKYRGLLMGLALLIGDVQSGEVEP